MCESVCALKGACVCVCAYLCVHVCLCACRCSWEPSSQCAATAVVHVVVGVWRRMWQTAGPGHGRPATPPETATIPPPAVAPMFGMLLKRGHKVTSWRERYFELVRWVAGVPDVVVCCCSSIAVSYDVCVRVLRRRAGCEGVVGGCFCERNVRLVVLLC